MKTLIKAILGVAHYHYRKSIKEIIVSEIQIVEFILPDDKAVWLSINQSLFLCI